MECQRVTRFNHCDFLICILNIVLALYLPYLFFQAYIKDVTTGKPASGIRVRVTCKCNILTSIAYCTLANEWDSEHFPSSNPFDKRT